MNQKQEIVLGFSKVLKKFKYDSESEEEDEFPSKVGGQPIWMVKDGIPNDIQCDLCKSTMIFVMQVFSPLNYAQSYNRTLYVFQCLTPTCQNKPTQMKVFRAQLAKQFKLSENSKEGSEKNVLEKQYKIITDIETKKEARQIELRAEEQMNSLNVADEELQIHKNAKKEDYEKEFDMAKQYAAKVIQQQQEEEKQQKKGNNKSNANSRKSSVAMDDSDDDDLDNKDRAFIIYDNYMNQIGQHVIRFCRHKQSMPLWFSDKNQWAAKDIQKCSHCGANKIFEFQINNALMNMYDELICQDWGIAAIYTCEKSCVVEGQTYVQEQAKLQLGTEDPLTLKEIENRVKQMQLEDEEIKKMAGEFDDDENDQQQQKQDDDQNGVVIQEQQEQQEEEVKENDQEQQQQQQQQKKKRNKKKKKQDVQIQEQQQQQQQQQEEEEEDDW